MPPANENFRKHATYARMKPLIGSNFMPKMKNLMYRSLAIDKNVDFWAF